MTRTILVRSAAALLLVGGCVLGPASPAAHAASDEIRGVAADGFGNVYISGATDGGLAGPSAGSFDAFVAKYDAAGNLQWTRQLGTAEFDESGGVSADGLGNVYISGTTSGSLGGLYAGVRDAFVTKYDAAGNLQWTRQLGTGQDDVSYGASADGLGNVYISGTTDGSLGGPSAGSGDTFLSKYDAAGSLQWTRQLGSSKNDRSEAVSADGLGNVYISGLTQGSLGGPYAGGNYDAFVSKYDAAGSLQWTRQLGTAQDDYSRGVSADTLGNVYISGFTNGGLGGPSADNGTAFVSKYDAAGALQWTRQFGTAGDVSFGVSADSLGNIYISGFTNGSIGGPSAGDQDAFLIKYDAAGNLQWTRQLGTRYFDVSSGVSADGLENVYISGVFKFANAFVAGYGADGSLQWTEQLRENFIPEPGSWLLAFLASVAVLRCGKKRIEWTT
jgi:hypothetical protein